MRRTRDAWIISADQHFERANDLGVALIETLYHQLLHVILDILKILAGRDHTISSGNNSLSIDFIMMKQQAARSLNCTDATTGPNRYRSILVETDYHSLGRVNSVGQQRFEAIERVFRMMNTLNQLRHC